jgi:hypothetical protein
MADLVIIALLVEESPSHFVLVVSSAGATPLDTDTHTDVEIADEETRKDAEATRRRLVGVIADRAMRRGDSVQRVRWIQSAARQAVE